MEGGVEVRARADLPIPFRTLSPCKLRLRRSAEAASRMVLHNITITGLPETSIFAEVRTRSRADLVINPNPRSELDAI